MELRGFDSYTVTLGDELRGERACRGWTLKDAARELCMKPAMISAIEDADLSAFPNRSVVPGYVRSYARYLGLDGDEIYARFCEESGFESTLVTFGMSGTAHAHAPVQRDGTRDGGLSGPVGGDFAASRFAVRPAPRRIGATISLGGLVSALALTALVGGVGYGGWTVLQDIQRVGFVPLPEAPAVVADAPEIDSPQPDSLRPSASAYADGGALFGIGYAGAQEVALRRDGPISAIDPSAAGILRIDPVPAAPPSDDGIAVAIDALPDAARADLSSAIEGLRASKIAADMDPAGPVIVAEAVVAEPAGPPEIVVVATEPAWIRVRAGDTSVLFEGTLKAGEQFALPVEEAAASIRAGNAGSVYVTLDGTRYGPLGRTGEVIKGVSLAPAEIATAYGEVAPEDITEAVAAAVPARP